MAITRVYFDSQYTGTEGAAYLGPSGAGTIYSNPSGYVPTATAGNELRLFFACGSYFGRFDVAGYIKQYTAQDGKFLADSYMPSSDRTARPQFSNQTLVRPSTDWTECAMGGVVSGQQTQGAAQAGTNYWFSSGRMIGLFPDRWGQKRDLGNATGTGIQALNAPYQWARANASTKAVVYSVGNPSIAFGEDFKVLSSAGAEVYKAIFQLGLWRGGIEIRNLEFVNCEWTIYIQCSGSEPQSGVVVESCVFDTCWCSVTLDGPTTRSGGGFIDARIRFNRVKNAGGPGINIRGYSLVDGLRIACNIIYEACQAESNGAIYISQCYVSEPRNPAVRGQVKRNYVYNTGYGNYWPHDGFGLYAEEESSCIDWRENLLVDNVCGVMAANGGATLHRWMNNWVISDNPLSAADFGHAEGRAFAITLNPTAASFLTYKEVLLAGNVAKGYANFLLQNATNDAANKVALYGNVGEGVSTASSSFAAVRRDSRPGELAMARNNLHGYWPTSVVKDFGGTTNDQSFASTETTTTNKVAEILAALPTIDKTRWDINYALLIPPVTLQSFAAALEPAEA